MKITKEIFLITWYAFVSASTTRLFATETEKLDISEHEITNRKKEQQSPMLGVTNDASQAYDAFTDQASINEQAKETEKDGVDDDLVAIPTNLSDEQNQSDITKGKENQTLPNNSGQVPLGSGGPFSDKAYEAMIKSYSAQLNEGPNIDNIGKNDLHSKHKNQLEDNDVRNVQARKTPSEEVEELNCADFIEEITIKANEMVGDLAKSALAANSGSSINSSGSGDPNVENASNEENRKEKAVKEEELRYSGNSKNISPEFINNGALSSPTYVRFNFNNSTSCVETPEMEYTESEYDEAEEIQALLRELQGKSGSQSVSYYNGNNLSSPDNNHNPWVYDSYMCQSPNEQTGGGYHMHSLNMTIPPIQYEPHKANDVTNTNGQPMASLVEDLEQMLSAMSNMNTQSGDKSQHIDVTDDGLAYTPSVQTGKQGQINSPNRGKDLTEPGQGTTPYEYETAEEVLIIRQNEELIKTMSNEFISPDNKEKFVFGNAQEGFSAEELSVAMLSSHEMPTPEKSSNPIIVLSITIVSCIVVGLLVWYYRPNKYNELVKNEPNEPSGFLQWISVLLLGNVGKP